MQIVSFFLIVQSFFFTFWLAPRIGHLTIQLVKSITRLLGEASEGDQPYNLLKNLVLIFKYLFFMICILFCVLIPLVPLFSTQFLVVLEPYEILIVSLAIFLILDLMIYKVPEGKTSVPFLEQVLLYFFYYDLRWAFKLSKISEFFLAGYHKKNRKHELKNSIFIISVARSGTTALTTKMIAQKGFSGLVYEHLPFSLCPELIGFFRKRKYVENKRLHSDKNFQNNNTSDALDEPMMVILDHWKDDFHFLMELESWHNRLAQSLKSTTLVFKNNNNFRRLNKLVKYDKAKFIVVFRDPIKTANSLKANHKLFNDFAKKDEFFYAYLRMMRHREFGPCHNPKEWQPDGFASSTETMDYWLNIWTEFAATCLEFSKSQPEKFVFLCSDKMITDESVRALSERFTQPNNCQMSSNDFILEKFMAKKASSSVDDLVNLASQLYREMKALEYK